MGLSLTLGHIGQVGCVGEQSRTRRIRDGSPFCYFYSSEHLGLVSDSVARDSLFSYFSL